MNTVNRLKNPAYFIPDPWTKTCSDNSWWSKNLSVAISQVVNDNAQGKVSLRSFGILLLGLLRFFKIHHFKLYFNLILKFKHRPWCKALLFDLFLHDLHLNLFQKKEPNFSTLFLNAGAHIQHHYYFNSEPVKKKSSVRNPSWYIKEKYDPVLESLTLYDKILKDYFNLQNTEFIVATGLSQLPCDDLEYYYRLKDHRCFLKLLGIEFDSVIPRMTRDFLINFNSKSSADNAERKLHKIKVLENNKPIFGEIDNRGKSLFIELNYPLQIDQKTQISYNKEIFFLKPHVVFVGIKNGKHDGNGYCFYSKGAAKYAPLGKSHIKKLYSSIKNYFSD